MNPETETRRYVLTSIAIFLLVVGFVGGYYVARAGYAISVSPVKIVNIARERAPQNLNWQILWDALAAINEKYVDRPVDQQQLLYGAVSGMVSSLGDPYTVFFTPQKAVEFKNDLKGEFSGIGAEIGNRSEQLVIIAPLEGSPAEAAGLKPLDRIKSINGESTEGLSLDTAVGKIRGPKGSAVTLVIMRDGESEPREVRIIRDTIVVRSVSSEIKESAGKKIGIIKLRRFGEDTKGELDNAITNLLNRGAQAFVLDVRGNPGGYISSAIEVASNWVEDGKLVVAEQYGDGRRLDHPADGAARLRGIPTVVLINEGSASASEIVAGALKDYELATLVGKKTFGKGSVQELVDLPDGADVKITIAKWLTPSGQNINVEGIKPDIEVEFSQEDADKLRDPQLERAIEFLITD